MVLLLAKIRSLRIYLMLRDIFLEVYYSCLPNIWKNYFDLVGRRVTRAKNSHYADGNVYEHLESHSRVC